MTYYINPVWFYLMNVSDWIHFLLLFFGFILVAVGIISAIVIYADCYIEDAEEKIELVKVLIVVGITSTLISAFVPSEKTCIEMMIASQVTKENVDASREEIYNIIDYVTEKMNGESEE